MPILKYIKNSSHKIWRQKNIRLSPFKMLNKTILNNLTWSYNAANSNSFNKSIKFSNTCWDKLVLPQKNKIYFKIEIVHCSRSVNRYPRNDDLLHPCQNHKIDYFWHKFSHTVSQVPRHHHQRPASHPLRLVLTWKWKFAAKTSNYGLIFSYCWHTHIDTNNITLQWKGLP